MKEIAPRILYENLNKSEIKPKFIRKFKPKKSYIILSIFYILLLVVLIILSLRLLYSRKKNALTKKNSKTNRGLYYDQNDPYNSYGSNNYQNNHNTEEDSIDPVAVVIVVLYALFLILSLYIGCELKSLAKSDEVFYSVLKYIYMANNGYLFISTIDNAMKASGVSMTTLGISVAICVIGTAIYLCKFCKAIFNNFFEHYFSCDMLRSWYCLPCDYIWNFISLTDPCCYCTHYTEYHYSDGTVTDDKCIVQAFNTCMYLLKRLSLILSTIVFYIFMLILTGAWIIIKIIYQIAKNVECNCCKGSSGGGVINNNNGVGTTQNNVMVYGNRGNNTNSNGNINVNINQNKDKQVNKNFNRYKSQIIPNNLTLQNNNNVFYALNRRKSMHVPNVYENSQENYSSNEQQRDIYIQDI